jgi:Ca-activated chloride channel family protein
MSQLANPIWLLLLPLPWLLWRFLPTWKDRRVALRVPFLDRLSRFGGADLGAGASASAPAHAPWIVGLLVWCLLVLAMARPIWLENPVTRERPMRDLLVAVDLSGSMETEDFTDDAGRTVDRLTAVKQVVGAFLDRREDDRVGLIVFGSAAFVQVPFTEDREVVRVLLDETRVRMAGPRTMLGDAIGLAITLFERSELEERMLILLTDGNDTGSRVPPRQAAEIARDKGVVIHTIAVGDPEAAGEEALDTVALNALAETTGGRAFQATDRGELEAIHEELDRITPRRVDVWSHRPQRDLFVWPLSAAFLISLAFHGWAARPNRLRERGGRS